MGVSLFATRVAMTTGRRRFVRIVSGAAVSAAAAPWYWAEAAAQGRALKDLVPKGWVIGAAINQNQSDGRDAVAVDLITRQFNTISPENTTSTW